MIDEFLVYRKALLGLDLSPELVTKLYNLEKLGYLPLSIKAVPEGTVLPVKNVLMTIANTHPDYAFLVGFFESLLLKVWNTCTVASYDLKFKKLVKRFADETCDDTNHLPFQVHDFGYRGCSSEETAALSGSAHLINFLGTDTVPALKLINDFYGVDAGEPLGLSVPATEHSVMCSFGPENEFKAFENMLNLYPSGVVSIVSDTYDLWQVLTDFAEKLKPRILARTGSPIGLDRVVFRPDSGNPEQIILGNPEAAVGSPEYKGSLQLLAEKFGTTTNSKGFKVLNPKVGLIYGDGMYFDRFERILKGMKAKGFASSNLVIGIGGLLLQQHNRDELGFAIKATYCEISQPDGSVEIRELLKDPITDHGKRSHKGLLRLQFDGKNWVTIDQCKREEEIGGELQRVFANGVITREQTFSDIRRQAIQSLSRGF